MQPASNIRAYFICDLLDMFNADSSFGAHAAFVTGLVLIFQVLGGKGVLLLSNFP